MRRILWFVKHRLRAKTLHGTHSPFVYDLIEHCCYAQSPMELERVHAHFQRLKHSKDVVIGVDYGKKPQPVEYRISNLAKTSSSRDFESALLAALALYHNSAKILELGTNIGKSAACIAAVNLRSKVTSIEGNAAICDVAKSQFESLGLVNIQVINEHFEVFWQTNEGRFDFIFIDGDHNYDSTIRNFNEAKQRLQGQGPIVLHDIYWSAEMGRAWDEIKRDPQATVCIDLFFFALVYFRPQQQKEHFDIRFPESLFRLLF